LARFIIVRLHPDGAVAASVFASYLSDLTIEAFEVSFGTLRPDLGATPLGSASFLPLDAANNRIFQHSRLEPGPPPAVVSKSIATAVLELTLPSPEYIDPDVILRVRRGGNVIATFTVDYNVPIADESFPANSADYAAFFQDVVPIAAYVPLSDPALDPDPTDAFVTLPKDGSPPSFLDLKNAITAVLSADPGNTLQIAALTAAQARHVAFEIMWNRTVAPLPTLAPLSLERVYTTESGESSSDEADRQTFEAELTRYRAMNDAQAEVLAKYVYSLSAALACEDASVKASRAGLRFPIRPSQPAATDGKIKEAEVVLKNP
jgi:hypothetical protein